jgi:HAD superfamily hydrolase (TIGR01509 family)
MRAVVFDMDGLMFNTEDVYTDVGSAILGRRGYEFTPELKHKIMGMRPQPAFEALISDCNLCDTWQDLATESNRLFLDLLGDRLRPMPGLLKLLDALESANIPKAIGTSSSRELVDACLRPFDLEKRFQFVLDAEDIVNGKPHPEIYWTAAKRFAVPPAEMLVLEDSQNGCLAAVAAGAFAVAVPGEHSLDHDFSRASLVVDSLADPRLYRALGLGKGPRD